MGTDPFPTVILEAMGCAKPVIATSIDGTVEQVVPGETGLIVPAEDVPALAGAMSRVITDRESALRWGLAGRERVCCQFGLPVLARKILALYRQLCGSAILSGQPEALFRSRPDTQDSCIRYK